MRLLGFCGSTCFSASVSKSLRKQARPQALLAVLIKGKDAKQFEKSGNGSISAAAGA